MKTRVTALTMQQIRYEIREQALERGSDNEEEYKKIEEEVLSALSDEEIVRYNTYFVNFLKIRKETDYAYI